MLTFSTLDRLLMHLTQALAIKAHLEESQKIQMLTTGDRKVRITCNDWLSAEELYQTAEDILEDTQYSGFSVEIFKGSNLYGTAPIASILRVADTQMRLSNMVHTVGNVIRPYGLYLEGEKVLEMVDTRNCAFVHAADRDRGFPFLAVRPSFSSSRLNRPIDQLLGNGGAPLAILDTAIAQPRTEAIIEAIETGNTVMRSYEYRWAGTKWKLVNRVRPIDGGNVLVEVIDEQNWQLGFWESSIAA